MNERVYYSEEARRNAQRKQLIIALAVAGVSLSIGTLIALLFAPDSGENVRQEIRSQLDEILERGGEATRDATHDARQRAENMRGKVEDRINSMQ
jgi:gas vesicle protein